MRSWNALFVLVVAVAVPPAYAQRAVDPARATCTAITQANAAAQMEKVFLFFSLVSKRTTVLPQK